MPSGKPGATLHEALAPHRRCDRGLRGRAAACAARRRLRGLFDEQFPMILPPDDGRRPRDRHPELQCRNPFLLHQRARPGVRRTGASARAQRSAFSESAMDRRIAPSSDGISHAGEGVFRTDRNRPDQWQLVRPQAASRSPTRIVVMHGHRHIDWIGACGATEDHLRAVAGDGPTDASRRISISTRWRPARTGGLRCWRRSAIEMRRRERRS